MKTRAIRIHETGGPEVMRLEEIDVADPGPGEVRVRQTAIGVNYIDTYMRSGLYALPSLPHGLGQEAAGHVDKIGPGVTGLAVGDRVAYGGGRSGAYAELRVLEATRLVRLPPDVGDVNAAALMLKGMTVEYLVRRTFPVKRGDTVLWHAAAGGVGLIACQWLRHEGVTVIGTVSTEEKAELARSHGATHVIIYTREDFVKRVRELTGGRGVPVVYDSVGKSTFEGSLDRLAPRGMMVSFGNASGKPPAIDPLVLSQKGSLYLTRPTLGAYTATQDELLESAGHVLERAAKGIIVPQVVHRFPLAEAAAAHRELEARKTVGSVILLA